MDFRLNLDRETVAQVNPSPPCCIDPETPVAQVLEEMKDRQRGTALVCRDGVLVGIFTERDALRLIAQEADLDVPVRCVMTSDPQVLPQSATVAEAIDLMAAGGYRRVPIVDGRGQPVGLVKTSGILHYLVDHFPQVIYNLPPHPDHTTQQREGA